MMKHRAVTSALLAFLLLLTASGINGCGKSNTVAALIVTPSVPHVDTGTVQQLLVTAVFSDGLMVTAWTRVTWTSSDTNVASVSTNGLVTGNTIGTAVVTATDMSHPNITASVTVSVTQLESIAVAPLDASISAGTSTQFTATGTYSQLSPSSWLTSTTTWPQVDITTSVHWTSSSTTVATISNALGSYGLATALSSSVTGTTTITATELATRITGTPVSGTTTLTVTP